MDLDECALILYLVLASEILVSIFLVSGMLFPGLRIWPPGGSSPWGQALMVFLFTISGIGTIVLGISDWGTIQLPIWSRYSGLALWLAGLVLALWAAAKLGFHLSVGGKDGLVLDGPYQWSRNPQYLGFITSLVGWGLLTASKAALSAGLAGCVPLLLVPLVEEPWLEDLYGKTWLVYQSQVPRWFRIRR